ncbi:MAG TPA: putative Ig domain-containing protein, partial [Leptospiraceae bacterium]|nr:putative Ig domain-containing protein [Leptospiraceae bacterium]
MRIGFLYLVVFCFAFLGCYNPKNNTDDSAKNGLLFWGLNVLKNSSDQVITGTGTGTGVGAGTGTGSTATAVTAPTSIIYAGSPYTYTRNTGITTLIPTLSPAGVSLTGCTASPALPAGLTLDSTTCAMSGTPTVSSTAAFYTITASNSAGNATATINITVEAIWAQEAYLKAPNPDTSDQFGISVSLSSDTIVVGAKLEGSNQTTITNGATASPDNSAIGAGAAYVFKRTGATWAQEAYLKAPNGDASDYLGQAVSVSADTIVVGAFNECSNQTTITNGTTAAFNNSTPASGAVYVFKRTGTTWAQEAYIKTPNPDVNDGFGRSVSVSSDTIVVGAIGESSNQATITNGATASADNSASNAGAVYVFKRTGSSWAMEAYLKAPNVELGDNFGQSVSVSSDMIAVGATGEDSNQATITNGTNASSNNSTTNAGAVYV